jgi:hypothetical protein
MLGHKALGAIAESMNTPMDTYSYRFVNIEFLWNVDSTLAQGNYNVE